jgi:hypothetical protein
LVTTRRYFCLGALAFGAHAQRGGGGPRADFSNWQSIGAGAWSSDDNEIIGRCEKGKSGKGYLLTREEFTDFRLNLLFWLSPGGSSGIYFREPKRKWGTPGEDWPGQGPNCGYVVGIDYHNRDYPTGSLYNVQHTKKIVGSEEQWTELEIICRGPEVRVTIAGKSINRFNQLRVQPGVIGFELPQKAPDGFMVRFRDVVLSPLA